jgi:hypothetical protein
MAEAQTCGLGLAQHSLIPAKLAEVTAAVAENLEAHMVALDLDDEDAKREHDVYARLVAQHRDVSTRLRAVGEDMAGSRDLPMGRHDMAAMSSPTVAGAFERFVTAERELLDLLQRRVAEDEAMLAQMRGTADRRA